MISKWNLKKNKRKSDYKDKEAKKNYEKEEVRNNIKERKWKIKERVRKKGQNKRLYWKKKIATGNTTTIRKKQRHQERG